MIGDSYDSVYRLCYNYPYKMAETYNTHNTQKNHRFTTSVRDKKKHISTSVYFVCQIKKNVDKQLEVMDRIELGGSIR